MPYAGRSCSWRISLLFPVTEVCVKGSPHGSYCLQTSQIKNSIFKDLVTKCESGNVQITHVSFSVQLPFSAWLCISRHPLQSPHQKEELIVYSLQMLPSVKDTSKGTCGTLPSQANTEAHGYDWWTSPRFNKYKPLPSSPNGIPAHGWPGWAQPENEMGCNDNPGLLLFLPEAPFAEHQMVC